MSVSLASRASTGITTPVVLLETYTASWVCHWRIVDGDHGNVHGVVIRKRAIAAIDL